MSKRVFIWVAHPERASLCEAIADAYEQGVAGSGGVVRRMDLCAMTFSSAAAGQNGRGADLDPDLAAWQQNIAWADHVFIVHPYWWGAMPARAKAVLDRALTSGFGYRYRDRKAGWDKLLTGKTADAIITSDTPPIIDTLIYRGPGRRVLKNQVLGFCGIRPRVIRQFGPVRSANRNRIAGWLRQARRMGASTRANSPAPWPQENGRHAQ